MWGHTGRVAAAKSWVYAESRCLRWCQSTWLVTTPVAMSGVFVSLWQQSGTLHWSMGGLVKKLFLYFLVVAFCHTVLGWMGKVL